MKFEVCFREELEVCDIDEFERKVNEIMEKEGCTRDEAIENIISNVGFFQDEEMKRLFVCNDFEILEIEEN